MKELKISARIQLIGYEMRQDIFIFGDAKYGVIPYFKDTTGQFYKYSEEKMIKVRVKDLPFLINPEAYDRFLKSITGRQTSESGIMSHAYPNFRGINSNEIGRVFDEFKELDHELLNEPVCKCGAKHSSRPTYHSDYCPLNDKK